MGTVVKFRPYGVDRITGDAVSLYLFRTKKTFSTVVGDIESQDGPIDLLFGINHINDDPKEHERGRGLILYWSMFGSGYMVCRNMTAPEEDDPSINCIVP
jgi:hypothetical protein